MAELTPMMKQYLEIKKDNPDSILFFRLGDFYEMFADDAKLASKELDLTLTSRDHGKNAKPAEERVPMCGIPYHASEAYIARLIAKGYKVAICEQMEDPATAKGLVKRDIIRVVTPGTVIDAACLEDKAGNYLCGIYLDSQGGGVAFCDLSTGKTHLTAFAGKDTLTHIINELGRFSPAEAILSDGAYQESALVETLREKFRCRVENGGEGRFRLAEAEKRIRTQFGEEALSSLPAGEPAAAMALGGLLSYLYETQKTDLSHINTLDYYRQGRFMELDLAARRNLELTQTLRGKEKKGSLLWVLDKTRTPMGGRLLRSWLERPLLSVTDIQRRSSAVAALVADTLRREELIAGMTGLGDMERLIGRIVYGTAGGRDMVSLRAAAEKLPGLKAQLSGLSDRRLTELTAAMDTLEDIAQAIENTLCDEPPFSVREGGFIRDGFHEEVDRLRHILKSGKGVIAEMEAKEKEKTGIRTLKIGYNKVFGYYIEVSNSFRELVPDTYIRKQTLVNGERFITQELKDLEHEILTASERVVALEYELFSQLRQQVAAAAPRIQAAAAAVAEVDALCSFAAVAVHNNYCRPEVDESGVIEIREGRHPVVEQVLRDTLFVPNDTFMGEKEEPGGHHHRPQHGRQIHLHAPGGAHRPHGADGQLCSGQIRPHRRGGSNLHPHRRQRRPLRRPVHLHGGDDARSADILRQATKNSLLILDEIGRGTSTFDGMAIARAVLEYCADKKTLGAKTLFATHYHELTELEGTLPGTVNYNIAVKRRGEDIIFLRKIVPGGADRQLRHRGGAAGGTAGSGGAACQGHFAGSGIPGRRAPFPRAGAGAGESGRHGGERRAGRAAPLPAGHPHPHRGHEPSLRAQAEAAITPLRCFPPGSGRSHLHVQAQIHPLHVRRRADCRNGLLRHLPAGTALCDGAPVPPGGAAAGGKPLRIPAKRHLLLYALRRHPSDFPRLHRPHHPELCGKSGGCVQSRGGGACRPVRAQRAGFPPDPAAGQQPHQPQRLHHLRPDSRRAPGHAADRRLSGAVCGGGALPGAGLRKPEEQEPHRGLSFQLPALRAAACVAVRRGAAGCHLFSFDGAVSGSRSGAGLGL